jgi:hypothetical protein
MSELKFSCPHCAQHISCDPAWAGHSLPCPSCQKQITAPQPQPKTGLRVSGSPAGGRLSAKLRENLRQATVRSSAGSAAQAPPPIGSRSAPPRIGPMAAPLISRRPVFSLLRIVLVLGCIFGVLLIAAFGWSFHRRSLRLKAQAEWRENFNRQQAQRAQSGQTRNVAPALYREPKLEMPTNAVAGFVGGQKFHYEHATVSMHRFTLREGKNWQADKEVTITTFVKPQDLAGKTLLVTPDNKFPRLHVSAEWLDQSKQKKYASAMSGYFLRLKCGPIENGRISGTMNLQMPGSPVTAINGDFIAAVK